MNAFNPSTVVGKTYKIPGLEGDVSFTIETLAPNEMGEMDAWFSANDSVGDIRFGLTYTGHQLREMGFEIPPWNFNNVGDHQLDQGEEMSPEGMSPEESPIMAESIVESMIEQDKKARPAIDWNERLRKLRVRKGHPSK